MQWSKSSQALVIPAWSELTVRPVLGVQTENTACDVFSMVAPTCLKVSGHDFVPLQKCILTEVHLGVLMKSFGKRVAPLPHSDCPLVPLGQDVCMSTAHVGTLKTRNSRYIWILAPVI